MVSERYAIMQATIEQVKSAGGSDIKVAHSTNTIFATLTEAQATKLKLAGCVVNLVNPVTTAVAPPAPVAAIPAYTATQLMHAAGFEEVRGWVTPPLYGQGINVAVIDTGIRHSHEQIRGRVIYSENFTPDTMRDGFDHGTGVASIIVTVAPECGILNIKVLDDDGEGTEEEVVLGIDKLLSLHDGGSEFAPRIINLSLGALDNGNPSTPLRVICREAIRRGIWVTAAAGNSGPTPGTIMSPACEKYVCALGSCKLEPFEISSFSSRGPTLEGLMKPDAVFFGENIELASSSSDTATTAKSGTSFSTPFSAGAWSLYYEGVSRQLEIQLQKYPEYANALQDAASRLISSEAGIDEFLPRVAVKPQGVQTGKDNSYGYGLPFGPLVIQQYAPLVPAITDFSSMIGAIIVIGIMGIIMRKL